jgi:hypothetical protein
MREPAKSADGSAVWAPSPKARVRTSELAPSIIAIGLILRFKVWMVSRVFIFGAPQSWSFASSCEVSTASIVPAGEGQ